MVGNKLIWSVSALVLILVVAAIAGMPRVVLAPKTGTEIQDISPAASYDFVLLQDLANDTSRIDHQDNSYTMQRMDPPSLEPSFVSHKSGEDAILPVSQMPSPSAPSPEGRLNDPLNKLRDLQNRNGDAIGWLVLDGTDIDFPVLQASDNEYYLQHDEYRNRCASGAVALDYRLTSDFTNKNNMLYAHNLGAAGRGFSEIVRFKEKSFFDSHTTGMLYTLRKTYRLEIFAVRVIGSTVDPYFWNPTSPTAFKGFLDEIKTNSVHYRNKSMHQTDRLMTFCTCSYEFSNARTVVHAKMIEVR